MNKTPLRILSIIPGTRSLGIAIFNGNDLYDCAVKKVSGKDLRKKSATVRSIIQNYISFYNINVITLKNLRLYQTSRVLQCLISEIKKISDKHKLTLFESSIYKVKADLLSTKRKNRHRLMEEITIRYPFLYPEMERAQKSKNLHFIKMFDAVAVGLACFNNLDNGKEKVEINKNK